jgi:hypothetical protein
LRSWASRLYRQQALTKAAGSKKVASFKANIAAEAVEDEVLKAKLQNLQEKQIQKLGGVDGNWLVLGDMSGSMQNAIEVARQVAATLAKMVTGSVTLVFFNTAPRLIDATGKTYEQILAATKHIIAGGGTSIGCGLLAIADKKIDIDGIAVVSDGGESSSPMFAPTYKAYSQAIGKEVPVYLYRTQGEADVFSKNLSKADIDCQVIDLSQGKVDYYALPGIVATMNTKRYGVIESIMDTPLLTLGDVFDAKTIEKGQKVYA